MYGSSQSEQLIWWTNFLVQYVLNLVWGFVKTVLKLAIHGNWNFFANIIVNTQNTAISLWRDSPTTVYSFLAKVIIIYYLILFENVHHCFLTYLNLYSLNLCLIIKQNLYFTAPISIRYRHYGFNKTSIYSKHINSRL